VEGNISVGKSTFLQKIASETIELQDLVESLSDMPTHSRTMSLLHVSCRSVNLQMG
jgi:deoxyadenosine/deoxycytidine kinase